MTIKKGVPWILGWDWNKESCIYKPTVTLLLEDIFPPNLDGICQLVRVTTTVIIAYDRRHPQPVITLTWVLMAHWTGLKYIWVSDLKYSVSPHLERSCEYVRIIEYIYPRSHLYTDKYFPISIQKNSTGKSSELPPYRLRSPVLDIHLLKFVCISLDGGNIFCNYELKAYYGRWQNSFS